MTLAPTSLLLAILATAPTATQDEGKSAAAAADPVRDPVRLAASGQDPRALPRADEGRWKDFETTAPRPDEIPPGVREAFEALRDHDPLLALAELFRALRAQPDYPPALYESGVVYFRLQRYGDAIVVLERFLRHVPGRIGDTRVLGHCYYSLGDYSRAKAHYGRVLAASPDDVEALRGLGLCEMRLGDSKRALELLAAVLEKQPAHAEAWAWRARILCDEDRSAEALEAAVRARDLQPWEPRPWFLLGQILADLGREGEGAAALARYRELNALAQESRSIGTRLRFDPHQVPLLARLVDVHRGTGNVPGAREALARLAKERPTDVDLRILAVDVLESMEDADGARLAATSLAQRCADEWKAWKRLETYYARLRDRQKQLEAGERYRRLKPD